MHANMVIITLKHSQCTQCCEIRSLEIISVIVYLVRISLGPKKVSLLVRCPDFGNCTVHKQGVWDSWMCPSCLSRYPHFRASWISCSHFSVSWIKCLYFRTSWINCPHISVSWIKWPYFRAFWISCPHFSMSWIKSGSPEEVVLPEYITTTIDLQLHTHTCMSLCYCLFTQIGSCRKTNFAPNLYTMGVSIEVSYIQFIIHGYHRTHIHFIIAQTFYVGLVGYFSKLYLHI